MTRRKVRTMNKALVKQLLVGMAASLLATALIFRVEPLQQIVTGTRD